MRDESDERKVKNDKWRVKNEKEKSKGEQKESVDNTAILTMHLILP